MSNSEQFNNGEGDAFYRRNRDALDAYRFDEDPLAKMILASGIKPSFVVDVGCANGKRLLGLCRHFKIPGMGIDPSHDAIAAHPVSGSIPLFRMASDARADVRNSISRLEPSISLEPATIAAENV